MARGLVRLPQPPSVAKDLPSEFNRISVSDDDVAQEASHHTSESSTRTAPIETTSEQIPSHTASGCNSVPPGAEHSSNSSTYPDASALDESDAECVSTPKHSENLGSSLPPAPASTTSSVPVEVVGRNFGQLPSSRVISTT